VFDEVPQHHVPAARREARAREVLSGELLGQSLEQSPERVERVEHLAVARGVGAPALDDVLAVCAVAAGGVQERLSGGERVGERFAQLGGGVP
jgi:hypothetical protein